MRRWIAAFVLLALSAAPAAARGPETLTPEIQKHLESLAPLRGLDRVRPEENFRGRPVLVKFFSSW